MSTIYLITGANRGIGHGLAELFLSRPNNIVVAAVRDPTSESAQSLLEAKTGVSSKAILVKIDSNSEIDAKDAVRKLQDQHNITHLDVVIANAGQNNYFSPVRAVTMAEMRQVLEVNSYAPIILFQAVLPLLEKSSKPIFATMGSMMGTIGAMEQRPFPCTSYGVSKAALNWITRKVHCEHENIIAFVLDPGFVQTDMGNEGARLIGLEKAYTTVDECVEGLVKGIDSASREKTSGTYVTWDGSEVPW